MATYVCGFAMSLSREVSRLLLVRDGDFLNGVSGRSKDERLTSAMMRVWRERTGKGSGAWKKFGELVYPDREVMLYRAHVPMEYLLSLEMSDTMILVNPHHIGEYDVQETLRWLIPMLLTDEMPINVRAEWL